MESKLRIRYIALALGCALALTIAPSKPVKAFKLPQHRQLLREALESVGVGPEAMTAIIGWFPLGGGNLGSDADQFTAYRHFDNARNATEICALANAAWAQFYSNIRDPILPSNAPEYDQVWFRAHAQSSFGELTHTLQDFYSHSNWIELFVDAGASPPLALPLFPSCTASVLQGLLRSGDRLQTGYFNIIHWAGCPISLTDGSWKPPTGYDYCHETLNKDWPESPHGDDIVPGYGITYHVLAMQLARAHTTKLYESVVSSLQNDWAAKFPNLRSECLIDHVFKDSHQPCRFSHLDIINDSHAGGVRLGDGSLVVRLTSGSIVAAKSLLASGWPKHRVDVRECLRGMTVEWEFTVADNIPPPSPRTVRSSAVLPAGSCDASIHIKPESHLHYLIRFTSTDTVLDYTEVIAVINNGQRSVSAGQVARGATVWLSLGSCTTVANYDFIIRFISPLDGAPRTATPEGLPLLVEPGCNDTVRFGDLGGSLYPPPPPP